MLKPNLRNTLCSNPCECMIASEEDEPPVNTQQASISPPPQAGNESEVDEGQWESSTSITFSYQWQLDGVDIIGATLKTILVLVGMVGQALRCIVTATNQYGSSVSITAAVVVVI